MSEESNGGFFGQLKNQIIAGVGVAITAAGATFMDAIKEQLGLSEPEPEKTEEVVQQPAQQPNITINVPEQKPAETKTIIIKDTVSKKQPPKKTETEKRKEEGWDW